MKRKLLLCTLSAFFATMLTGCASTIHPMGDFVELHATPAGLDAWFEGTNGLMQSAKGNPHELDNHHKLMHDKENTKRTGLKLQFGGADHGSK